MVSQAYFKTPILSPLKLALSLNLSMEMLWKQHRELIPLRMREFLADTDPFVSSHPSLRKDFKKQMTISDSEERQNDLDKRKA